MAPDQPYPLLGSSAQRPVRAIPVRSIAERRIDEFIGGQYAKYNLASMLFEAKKDDADMIWAERWSPPRGDKPSWKEAASQKYTKCKKGDTFGPSWTNHWLKIHIKIPDEWRKKEWLQLEFDPSCEALIFSHDGEPLQGITGGFEDTRRVDFPLKTEYRKPEGYTFYAEVTCNAMFGVPSDYTGDPDPNRTFALNSLDIVIKRPRVWSLMWTFDMLSGAVKQMPRDGPLQNKALWACNRIQDTFRKGDLESVEECHRIAEEVLGKGWEAKGAKVYDEGNWTDADNTAIWSLGHTHIDTAWLWPFSATQQKVARSWCTQLDLMDRYPEHRFIASTAQQYAWLEELYPSLFERVRKAVKDGRFIPEGGAWVECDANMPSGEAFVRQFLYGQRFFRSRFGKRCEIFWLPDSFGYNAQIPQMARSAGLNYFFTQKLSWSSINTFPHSTFVWQGLDGTQEIVHMTPVNNYDSKCGLDDIRRGVTNNKNLDVQPTALLLFGFGDGGGGPTEVMLERQRRARAMYNNGYTEVPKVTVGRSAGDFFANIVKRTDGGERLPTWIGEIYLEFHRGVYTSHGSIKKWNRSLEVLLHNIEWVATLASIKSGKGAAGYEYPKAQLDDLWEPLLTNQFHDVLPGSSIRLVYDDAERIYSSIDRRGRKLLADATAALTAPTSKAEKASTLAVVNTLAVPRGELVRVSMTDDLAAAKQRNDMTGVAQWGGDATALLLLEDVAASGMAHLVAEPQQLASGLTAASATTTGHNSFSLRNSALSLRVEDGRIVSIRDTVVGRELLDNGRTAGFTIFEDMPPSFDAWETELYSLNTREEIKFGNVRIAESGPWRAALALEARFGQSSIHLTVSLDALPASMASHSRDARSLLRFDADVDWHEKHRFLRFEVPTTLRADEASYETQFGITKRPTSRNTTWEAAKFEVCGHRFADLSEPTYGVALITDSKYGYSVEGSLMRISLLKAATYPDAHQDEGKHVISFAIYPHAQHFVSSDVVTVARLFSNPLEISAAVLASAGQRSASAPAIAIEGAPSVVLDTMKRGEQDFPYYQSKGDGTTTVVVRLYESIGTHASVVLSTSLPVKRITSCNILEDDEEELLGRKSTADGLTRVKVALRGFQFRTLKLWLA